MKNFLKKRKVFLCAALLFASMITTGIVSSNFNTFKSEAAALKVKNGTYLNPEFSFSGGSGKLKIACEKVVVTDEESIATLVFSSSYYVYVKINGVQYNNENDGGKSTFTIPVKLNETNEILAATTAMSEIHEVRYEICVTVNEFESDTTPKPTADTNSTAEPQKTDLPQNTIEPDKTASPQNTVTPQKTTSPQNTVTPQKTSVPQAPQNTPVQNENSSSNQNGLKNGLYSVEVSSNATMFKIAEANLKIINGKMMAAISLSGTGYDALFVGTAIEADNSGGNGIIYYYINSDGLYTFEIPVEALDKEIQIAAHAVKSDKWYDRIIVFNSQTLVLLEEYASDTDGFKNNGISDSFSQNNNGSSFSNDTANSYNDSNNNASDSPINQGLTSDSDIADMIKNTKSGEVTDGTYTPHFGYKGGTGKVTISCNKVVVKDGKATATLVFSSKNYTYVAVDGVKYYNENKGGNATFIIPVNLNGTTKISALTTTMSQPHEIDYELYVYIDGTEIPKTIAQNMNNSSEEVSEEAVESTSVSVFADNSDEENSWGAFGSVQRKNDKEENSQTDNNDTEKEKSLDVYRNILIVVGVFEIIAFALLAFGAWKLRRKWSELKNETK